MRAFDIFLRLIGAFYIFAGVVGLRAALFSHFLDKALAGLGAAPADRREHVRSLWLMTGSVLVGVSGLALLILWEGAAWLFALNTALQAFYLGLLAPYYLDRDDPPDPNGRRQTFNAFVIYTLATGLVIAGALQRRLLTLEDLPPATLALAAGLTLAGLAYAGWRSTAARRAARDDNGAETEADDQEVFSFVGSTRAPGELPQRILLMAEVGGYPTWEVTDISEGFDPAELALSEGLAGDLAAWALAYDASLDLNDPVGNPLWSDAQVDAHALEGRALAIRIAQELAARGRGDIALGYFRLPDGATWLTAAETGVDPASGISPSAG